MPRVFIALENMASAFGFKKHNTHMDDKKPSKESVEKYKGRIALAEKAEVQYKTDSSEGKADNNIHFIVKMVAAKRGFRYGTAGSLTSLMKRMEIERGNSGGTFNVLVFLGHGNTGLMTTGLGNLDFHQMEKSATKKNEKQVIDGFNIENRMINVSKENKSVWIETFQKYGDCLDRELVHIMFMGCATGNQSETSFKWLPKTVAKALAAALNRSVICYGTDKLIENSEMESALTNIGTITETVERAKDALTDEVGLPGTKANLKWFYYTP